jgi:DNA invertase Pin-like site-specific DNA recombinase
MTTFLIVISFLIHALSLFALIILFQRQNKMSHSEKKMKQAAAEMEEMMTGFLIQIQEENEQLITELTKKAAGKRAKPPVAEEQENKPLPRLTTRKAAAKAYSETKPAEKETKPQADMPLAKQMAEMRKKGMKDEEIARALHVGVTEVKLALKFNKGEQK